MDARENVRIQRAEGINGALLIQDGKKENSPVGERPFDLDLMQEGGDAWKDMSPAQHLLAMLHELCDGVLAIPDALLELRRDESHRLGLIELEAAREALVAESRSIGGGVGGGGSGGSSNGGSSVGSTTVVSVAGGSGSSPALGGSEGSDE